MLLVTDRMVSCRKSVLLAEIYPVSYRSMHLGVLPTGMPWP